MPLSQWKLARLTPNLGILWISVCSFWLCGSIVANPIIYRLVPSPSRYEIRQYDYYCGLDGKRRTEKRREKREVSGVKDREEKRCGDKWKGKRKGRKVKKSYPHTILLLICFAEDDADTQDGGESASGEEPTTPPPPAGGTAPTTAPGGGAAPSPNPIIAAVVSFSEFLKVFFVFHPGVWYICRNGTGTGTEQGLL